MAVEGMLPLPNGQQPPLSPARLQPLHHGQPTSTRASRFNTVSDLPAGTDNGQQIPAFPDPAPAMPPVQGPEGRGNQAGGGQASLLARRALANQLNTLTVSPQSPQVDTQSQPSPSVLGSPIRPRDAPSPGSPQQSSLQSPGSPGPHLGLSGSALNMSFRASRGSFSGSVMRMSFTGGRVSYSGAPRASFSGSIRGMKVAKPKQTAKEFVAHHFWKHYEKFRQAEIAAVAYRLDIAAQMQARTQQMGQMFEFGFVGDSHQYHVSSVLQAQRIRERIVPDRVDGNNQWTAALKQLTREEAAAIVIQRWWRALMDFRRITWPEIYDVPRPKKEKPPIYVWSSSESEGSEDDVNLPVRQYIKKPKPGNKAGFGTSALKPMNKNARQPSVAVPDTGLIWGSAASTHAKPGVRSSQLPSTNAASRYLAGVGAVERNMRRRKRKVASTDANTTVQISDLVQEDSGGDIEELKAALARELGGMDIGPLKVSAVSRPTTAHHTRHAKSRAVSRRGSLREGVPTTDPETSEHYDDWGYTSDESSEAADPQPTTPSPRRSRIDTLLRASNGGASLGPVMGHLKFWGHVKNPKCVNDSRFFLPHMGEVQVVQSERDMFQGAIHLRSVAQVLKPTAHGSAGPPFDVSCDPLSATASPPHTTHHTHPRRDSRSTSPTHFEARLIGRAASRGARSTADASAASGGGARATSGRTRKSADAAVPMATLSNGQENSPGSLQWINDLHASYASVGALHHQLQQSLPPDMRQTPTTAALSGVGGAGGGHRTGRHSTSCAGRGLGGGGSRPRTVPVSAALAQDPPPAPPPWDTAALAAALTAQRQRLFQRESIFQDAYDEEHTSNTHPTTSQQQQHGHASQCHQGVHTSGNNAHSPKHTPRGLPCGPYPAQSAPLPQEEHSRSLLLLPESDIKAGRISVPVPVHSLTFQRPVYHRPMTQALQPVVRPARGTHNPVLVLQSLRPPLADVDNMTTSAATTNSATTNPATATSHAANAATATACGTAEAGSSMAVSTGQHSDCSASILPHSCAASGVKATTGGPSNGLHSSGGGAPGSREHHTGQVTGSVNIAAAAAAAVLAVDTSHALIGTRLGSGSNNTPMLASQGVLLPSARMQGHGELAQQRAATGMAGRYGSVPDTPQSPAQTAGTGTGPAHLRQPAGQSAGALTPPQLVVSRGGGAKASADAALGSLVHLEGRTAGKAPLKASRPMAGLTLSHPPPTPTSASAALSHRSQSPLGRAAPAMPLLRMSVESMGSAHLRPLVPTAGSLTPAQRA